MNRKQVIFCKITIAVILLLFAFSGCKANKTTTSESTTTHDITITYAPTGNYSAGEYTTFMATGIPLFTFEYPIDYVITSYQLMPEYPSTNVMIRALALVNKNTTVIVNTSEPNITTYMINQFPEPDFNDINIYIAPPSPYTSTAEAAADKDIIEMERLKADGACSELKVVYKHQVIVGGNSGWEVKYSFINYPYYGMQDWLDKTSNPIPVVFRKLLFVCNDMLFTIYLISDESNLTEAEKAYEHILQTFELLE